MVDAWCWATFFVGIKSGFGKIVIKSYAITPIRTNFRLCMHFSRLEPFPRAF